MFREFIFLNFLLIYISSFDKVWYRKCNYGTMVKESEWCRRVLTLTKQKAKSFCLQLYFVILVLFAIFLKMYFWKKFPGILKRNDYILHSICLIISYKTFTAIHLREKKKKKKELLFWNLDTKIKTITYCWCLAP